MKMLEYCQRILAKVSFDRHLFAKELSKSIKRLEEQVKDAIAKLKPLIPLSFETVRLAFKIPGSAYGSVHRDLRSYQQKEGWLEDGSWACVIECPAGMKADLIGQVMRRSSDAEVKELNS